QNSDSLQIIIREGTSSRDPQVLIITRDFEITLADLHEYAANFAKGIGLVEGDKRAPINYAHESWDKAAGWITALSVNEARQALVASVEWTPEGAKGLKDGEWAYISPEFCPRGSLPYSDPEGPEGTDGIPEFTANVLTGAGLTNTPLFKKLKPIMASRIPPKRVNASAAGDGDKHNQGEPMDLKEIRAKQVADLTEEEKTFLSENKADLTAEELKTFGLEEADDEAANADASKEAADKEAAEQAEADAKAAAEQAETDKIEASRNGGVSITADRLAKLEADAQAGREARQQLDQRDAEEIVDRSIKAGQIKSGDKARWTKQLLASRGDDRKELETLLAGLPKNEIDGKEIGDQGAAVTASASAELHAQVAAAIKASADKGSVLSYSQARKDILAADAELKQRIKDEEEDK
ncbi:MULTISPECIES: phage protease, partial [unclassified Rhodococcus (in: high G+C Gram-positive bacteria)]|uniref:phage protease n=2 Tax=unclassified Rhodococcus (in: high G+C Gram-positive bacteria) TaxID=192944 RepID=UPI0029531F9A